MIIVFLFALICGSSVAQSSRCVQGENCRLPECFCPTFQHPVFEDIKDIPQMVYFAFDDALHAQVDRFYRQLFTKDRRNPNGCPISMSLYVQDQWTSYAMKLEFEAGRQKGNLTRAAHIPRDQIVGWRSPNLKTAGDVQPDVLKTLGYTYDISLTYTHHRADGPIPWPYTLDFGYPYGCSVRPCPRATSSHPGFWEVPVPSLYDPQSGYPCAYVDSCRPSDEAAAVEYLWSNFEKVYKSNRAPFGLNMHAAWFYSPQYLKASLTFLHRLLSLPDVYVLSVRQVLAWMKEPVKVSDISKLSEWSCVEATPISSARGTTQDTIGPTKLPLPHRKQETVSTYAPWITRQPRTTTHAPTYRPPNRTHQPPFRTNRPPSITFRPPNRTYQPPFRTNRPPSITYRPPNRTYQPPFRTYRPPSITYRPPTITYRPPNRTYQPPFRTYRPPSITYRPPNRTYQPKSTRLPPNRTYQPPNLTQQPPNRTYRPPNLTQQPPNRTYRPPNFISELPLSFIPRPSGTVNSSSNLQSNSGSEQHNNTNSHLQSEKDTNGQNMGSNVPNGIGAKGRNTSWNLQGSGKEGHKGNPTQPSPVLIQLNYHVINPEPGNNSVISGDNGQREETDKAGQSFGAEKDGAGGEEQEACVQEVTCSLPSCTCRSLLPPARLEVKKTPQIVYVTFTGEVNGLNYQRVLTLLTSRRNPNNCPISATFFVPLAGNYEPYVQSLRSRGDEIAIYGSDPYMFDHRVSIQQQIQREVETFRSHDRRSGRHYGAGHLNLGYRSPDGASLGNGMLEGLHAENIVYDASLVTSRQPVLNDVIPWPYTLDYGWKDSQPEASQYASGSYPGLWEVPLIPLVDTKKHRTCTFADGCHSHPTSAEDVTTFFLDNLNHALSTNRAPMGLHLRYEWFSDPLFYSNLRGLQIFLDAILGSRDDVFVVSVEKMLDWMKSPMSLDQIGSFEAWKC